MNKFKTLLLLTLGATALTVQAEVNNAQDVIDMLTANGGHCQALYYSASYQQDYGEYAATSTNNMWIKDSFGKAHFVDAKRTENVYGVECKVVTMVDAFGGLFDWDFYIDNTDGLYMLTCQSADQSFQAKGAGNENKYVRLHTMSGAPNDWGEEVPYPERKVSEHDFLGEEVLQLWTNFHDGKHFEIIGTPSWGHEKFDASLYLCTYLGMRWYFLRLAVKDKGADGIIGTADDTEDYHYDFYLAEFRHYNPNTIVNDTHNGDTRSYAAIADYENQADGTTKFWVHNFSGFGPCYTQELGTETDAELDAMLAGTGLTQLSRGYGEGKVAEIHPMTGYMGGDNKILIKRSDNPAGFTHYHRAYEAVKNVEGVTTAQIEANKFNPAITTWHDCRIAGLVEGKFERDDAGNIIPESITALKDEVTGTWTESRRHHHMNNGVASDATNPWVTDGGTCRTVSTKHLKIDPYVYCTDEQLADGMNPNSGKSGHDLYDYNDDYKRGGIYELIDIETTDNAEDITLDLAINNSNGEIVKNMQKVIKTDDQNNVISEHVAVPVEFTVNDNDQYVDHYELCIHECNGIHDVTVASDEAFANADSPLNEAMNDLVCTYTLEKDNYSSALRDTDGPKLYKAYVESGEYDKVTGAPIYTKVPNFDLPKGREYVTMTIFVKAVYTEESGLAPTYHSLQNVHVKHDTIVTGIDDINVESVKTSKVLENGQVFIIKNGVKYNTMGQRVK
ncbi:hypothetical protein [Sodaliphilus sp.]|uniref:hypothetical protein n=1 Tax=Sodaliphilus sp. TaxID=2815818 RepID=UPI00388EC1D3